MEKLVLAGDIGGTKTLLQLAGVRDGAIRPIREARFDSAAYRDFDSLLGEFMRAAASTLDAACFGVAGPIHGQSAKITNLEWTIDAAEAGARLGIGSVCLINDFSAVGHGIEALHQDDLITLQAGEPEARGTRAVLGAGTGLGEGILVWQGGHYLALPTEGGHVDFAPADEVQDGLLHYLRQLYGHVSYERILSGAGLVKIFEYLTRSRHEAVTASLRQAMQENDPAAAISAFGLDGSDPAAVRALDLFISIYGAQAGNLALNTLASGGVYVAGGIAPKIIARLRQGGFMGAFQDKGRFSGLMRRIPVHVVMNPKVGLIGAALVASRS